MRKISFHKIYLINQCDRTTDNKLVDDTTTMIQKVVEPAAIEEPEPISELEPMADPLTQEEAEAAVDPDLTKTVDSDDGYKVGFILIGQFHLL